MAIEIPFNKRELNYSFDVTLSSVVYTFRVYWNVRSQNYFVDITRAQDQEVVIRSVRIAVSTAPIANVVGSVRPPGELFVVDTSEKELDPTIYELGDRVKMLYFERAELE